MHILKAAAEQIGVPVHLITGKPREVVRDLLQTGDIFVFPSCYEETYGLCLTEAMSTGLACIASNVCGTRAQIEDGLDGLLVPPRDVGALAAAMERLLGDEPLRRRLGAAARATVEADRTLEHAGKRLVAVYEEVLGGST
jgi:glycosyltransferase involved in cell wall biosynthesis